MIAFRSQLPRANKFYAYDAEKCKKEIVKPPLPLCEVCGCRGPLTCSRCKGVNYCGQIHQRIDWKSSHKKNCSPTSIKSSTLSPFMFKEYELVIEPEEFNEAESDDDDDDEDGEEDEKKRVKDYEKLVSAGKTGELNDIPESEISQYIVNQDENFTKFNKRIEHNRDQVLRYEWNGDPLWIAKPTNTEIPNCENCGSSRVFEFQIMPQLLNKFYDENQEFTSESLDWGVIVVYSCAESCDIDSKYCREFILKQDLLSELSENDVK